MYVEYSVALEMYGILTLLMRREHRSLEFAPKCRKHLINSELFLLTLHVTLTWSETGTIPNLQRRLDSHYKKNEGSDKKEG